MTICHRVLPVRQVNQMTCWRACVDMMLGYYGVVWESTPEQGIPGEPGWQPATIRRQFNPASPFTLQNARQGSAGPQTAGLMAPEFGPMAEHYGFQRLDNDSISNWTPDQLETTLTRCGPLWHAIRMPFRHVVVLTGIGERGGEPTVSVNDPATGRKEFWTLASLNSRIVVTPGNPLYFPRAHNANGRGYPSNQMVESMPFDEEMSV